MLRASGFVSVLPPPSQRLRGGGGEERGRGGVERGKGGGSASVRLCWPGEGTALVGARQPLHI